MHILFREELKKNITVEVYLTNYQDGVWVGKSTLQNDQEFSVDTTRFPNISDIVSDLHGKNKLLLVDTRPVILVRHFSCLFVRSLSIIRDTILNIDREKLKLIKRAVFVFRFSLLLQAYKVLRFQIRLKTD